MKIFTSVLSDLALLRQEYSKSYYTTAKDKGKNCLQTGFHES